MPDQPKRGKRVQIYIPADLVERWDATPRYERSAEVAKGLRMLWGETTPQSTPGSGPVTTVQSEEGQGDA